MQVSMGMVSYIMVHSALNYIKDITNTVKDISSKDCDIEVDRKCVFFSMSAVNQT